MKSFHLIQVFVNSYKYGKPYKSYEDRKGVVGWKTSVESNGVIVEDDEILINAEIYNQQNRLLDNCIISIDYNINSADDFLRYEKMIGKNYSKEALKEAYNGFVERRDDLRLARIDEKPFLWNIFEFSKLEEIELKINWDYWKMGNPKRMKYKIAELKKNKPVEILSDGIIDFSMTGRRNRTFVENNYILEYKGEFDKANIIDDLQPIEKQIPKERKRINMLKNLK